MRSARLACLVVTLLPLCGRGDALADDGVASGAAHEVVHLPPAALPQRGPRFAPVTLDVYVIFGNHPSSTTAELARRAVERATDVREVLHLSTYGPSSAELAAEAALEAEAQGRFWPFVDRLLQPARQGSPAAPELHRIGREAGLDVDKLTEALASHRHRPTLERLARENRSAPHGAGELLVNGRRVYPSTDEVLATAVRTGRERARVLLDAGVPLTRVYDRLLDELKDELQQQEAQPGRAARKRLPVDASGSPARGPSLAPVTLVVFSNLSCASCADLAQLVRRIRERHPGRVREVWKHWLPPWGVSSVESAAADLAAGAELQGRFWDLHDLALSVPPASPASMSATARSRSRADFEALARSAGLDLPRLQRDQKAGLTRALVERDQLEARRLELRYGPVLLVNGVAVTGGAAAERVDRLVSDELGRGLLERLRPPAP